MTPQIILGILSLMVAVASLVWAVRRDSKKDPQVIVTNDKKPALYAELVSSDGAQFSIGEKTGVAYVPSGYVGKLIFVRDQMSRRELTRFVLKPGLNEISY